MASGQKKKGKPKTKTLNLQEWLTANDDGSTPPPVMSSTSSWATEMESADAEEGDDMPRSTFDRSKLPTAPKAARGPDVNLQNVPDKPPFTAFIGNLSYDSCEDKLSDFLVQRKLEVLSVRMPSDNGRLRGFAYVEFGSKEGLLNALALDEEMFSGRKLRVDLAGSQNRDDRDGGSNRSDRDDWRGGGGDPSRTEGDWRRRDPPAETDDRFSDRRGGGFDRDRGFGDRDRDRGFSDRDRGFSDRDRGFSDRDRGFSDRDRGFSDRGFSDRDRGFSDRDRGFSDRDRGFSDRGFSDRDRGFSDRGFSDRDRGFSDRGFSDRSRGGYDRGDDRRGGGFEDRRGGGGYDRYGGRSRYGDSGGDGGYGRRRDDGFRRDDNYSRPSYGGDGERREDRGGSRDGSQEAPKERRKLNLQPRTKAPEKGPAEPQQRQSSIFGDAKPVDTASKEREIEERIKKLGHPSEEKENFPRERQEGRPRRDSDRSDGGKSTGRERRHSNSSSKAGSSRRDSDTSRTSDDAYPADRESRGRMVPAPPPKENAWSRPRNDVPSHPAEPARQSYRHHGNQESQRYNGNNDRRSYDNDRRGGNSGRGGYPPRPDGREDAKREKQLPRSIEEMPKFNQGPAKSWEDTNKFAAIQDDNGGSDED